jgi:hypothetical protein
LVVSIAQQQIDENQEPERDGDNEIPDGLSADEPAARREPFDGEGQEINQ